MNEFETVEAFYAEAVTGHIGRYPTGVQRIITFVGPSGEHAHIALANPTVVDGTRQVAEELQVAEIETGEVLRDLGLYREG